MMSFIVFLVSCKKENNTPDQPVDDITPEGMVVVMGNFSGINNYQVQGTAKIFDNNGVKELRFENFSASNGPDLRVYLSKDQSASSFISLGKLKSVSGNQNYSIPGNPDFKEYRYVHIWCEQFTVRFGTAILN
jgi:hypothetical protein